MDTERVTVELDPAATAALRRRCLDRGGSLAEAAAAALHELAVRDGADALAAWYAGREDQVEADERETALALAELS